MIGDGATVPFAVMLRRARQAAELTQEELAERARVSWRTVSDLERGIKRPRKDTVALLVDALGLEEPERGVLEVAARRPLSPSAEMADAQAIDARTALRTDLDPIDNDDDQPGVRPAAYATPRLVGRAREQVVMRQALTTALVGRGSLVLIGGAAGQGKSALAEALCQESRARDACVLVGRCYDLAVTPPYWPWSEILAELPTSTNPLHDLTHPDLAAGITSQFALLDQVLATLETAACKRPLVLLLDDLHWADPASIDLLRHVARKLATLPILALVTYRDDELTRRHPLYHVLPALVHEAPVVRVDLRSLDEAGVQALVGDRYQLTDGEAARLAAYLHGHAEGNPFFVLEVLHTLETDGHLRRTAEGWVVGPLTQFRVPPLLRQVIEGRLARLDEEARRLLEVAAVIGQEIPLALWATVAGMEDDTLVPVVERAAEERLLEDAAGSATVRLSHALVRETLYEGMLAPRRRLWHRKVGEALAAQHARPDPDVVAYHFQQAGDTRAVDWLIRAGDRAQRTYAWLTAVARFEAALALLDGGAGEAVRHGWLLLRLAMLRRFDKVRAGVAYLEEAERLGHLAGERALAAAALFNRGLIRCMSDDVYHGVPELEAGVRALADLSPAERERLRVLDRLGDALDGANGQGELALWLAEVGRYAEAQTLAERLVAVSAMDHAGEAITDDSRGDAYYALGWTYAALGYPEEAHRAFAQARVAFRAIGHRFMLGSAYGYEILLVTLPYGTDRLVERRRLAAEMLEVWEHLQAATSLPPRVVLLDLLLLEGAWAEARSLLLAAEAPGGHLLFYARMLGRLAHDQGDHELAWAQVYVAFAQGPDTLLGASTSYAVELQRLAAHLAIDEGDLATARQWLEAHDRWLAWSGSVLGRAEALLGWAAYHRASSAPAPAWEAATAALTLATVPRQPLALLAAHRLLGELATREARWAEAEAHLEAALALADACAAPYERALTLLALAELREASGDRPTARTLIESVRMVCEPLGAQPALARAEAIAVRITSTPAVPASASAGLTAREAEVLRLLAEGLSNAAIAARLVVSPRTVNAHLTSIYDKLGVSSRSAAVAFAIDHGLR